MSLLTLAFTVMFFPLQSWQDDVVNQWNTMCALGGSVLHTEKVPERCIGVDMQT